jgi:hypothetical protein
MDPRDGSPTDGMADEGIDPRRRPRLHTELSQPGCPDARAPCCEGPLAPPQRLRTVLRQAGLTTSVLKRELSPAAHRLAMEDIAADGAMSAAWNEATMRASRSTCRRSRRRCP